MAQFTYTRGDLGYWRKDKNAQADDRPVMVTGKTDTSPLYRHWEGLNYHSDCSCCWLGIGHTADKHKQGIEVFNRK